MRLHDRSGARKYLTPAERDRFLAAAMNADARTRSFCAVLAYTGCRLSEALNLTAARIDPEDGVVIIESLKKRRPGLFRAVPVPPAVLSLLEDVHGIAALRAKADGGRSARLWPWSRATGWRRVRSVMRAAGLSGLHATPKGLRHGFGIKAVTSNVPLNMTQKWLGHAQLSTTSIYADAVGPEERLMAARMWN